MRQFYLGKNKSGYYRVYFLDPVTGQTVKAKSTHCKDKMEATILASSMLQNGVPSVRSNSRAFEFAAAQNFVQTEVPQSAVSTITTTASKTNSLQKAILSRLKATALQEVETKTKLCDFLWNYWDYDNKYIQRRLLHGHSVSKKHTINMQSYIKNNFRPYFGDDKCIEDLTRDELDDFFFYLREDKGLSGGTVNKNINCANVGFKHLVDTGKLKSNPLSGIEKFKPENKERGIPSEEEVKKLLQIKWDNETCKLAFALAALCGLRAGEISGLRVCDINLESDRIHIEHSFSEVDDLKDTKNHDIRDLPVQHSLAEKLIEQAKTNPYYSNTSYVFYAPYKPEAPFYPGYYADVFYKALEKIGISKEERKKRNIVFHSLRHFCATSVAFRTDMNTVMSIMGHKTKVMSEHYSNHESEEKLKSIRTIMNDVFEKYL